MTDPWDSEYRKCWRAAAAAFFASHPAHLVYVDGAADKTLDEIYKLAAKVGAEFAERATKETFIRPETEEKIK